MFWNSDKCLFQQLQHFNHGPQLEVKRAILTNENFLLSSHDSRDVALCKQFSDNYTKFKMGTSQNLDQFIMEAHFWDQRIVWKGKIK